MREDLTGNKTWTNAADARLRKLWCENLLSTAAIGAALGVSKNAAVGRAGRLGLPRKPSPIIRGSESGDKRPVKCRQKVTLAPLVCAPEILAAEPEPAPPLSRRLQSEPCCWPLGVPKTPSFRYCDEASVPGKTYCAAHCAVAFVRPDKDYGRAAA